jgi:hypothetical protein
MGWLNGLEEHAKKSAKLEKRKRQAGGPIQEVLIGVRPCSANDPGEVAVGYFIIDGDTVVLTDQNGKPLSGDNTTTKFETDPKRAAGRLLRARWLAARGEGDFNRKLDYPKDPGWR